MCAETQIAARSSGGMVRERATSMRLERGFEASGLCSPCEQDGLVGRQVHRIVHGQDCPDVCS